MRVYPEVESWNKFYPSEIFIRMESNDSNEHLISVLNKANIGATINVALTDGKTETYKKIGDIVSLEDMDLNLILLRRISTAKPGV